jgi:hypothetical protein
MFSSFFFSFLHGVTTSFLRGSSVQLINSLYLDVCGVINVQIHSIQQVRRWRVRVTLLTVCACCVCVRGFLHRKTSAGPIGAENSPPPPSSQLSTLKPDATTHPPPPLYITGISSSILSWQSSPPTPHSASSSMISMTRTTAHRFSTLYMATTLSPGRHSPIFIACCTADM